MTIGQKLEKEFSCAILAIFGDKAEEEYEEGKVSKADLKAIADKVAFYLDR